MIFQKPKDLVDLMKNFSKRRERQSQHEQRGKPQNNNSKL